MVFQISKISVMYVAFLGPFAAYVVFFSVLSSRINDKGLSLVSRVNVTNKLGRSKTKISR